MHRRSCLLRITPRNINTRYEYTALPSTISSLSRAHWLTVVCIRRVPPQGGGQANGRPKLPTRKLHGYTDRILLLLVVHMVIKSNIARRSKVDGVNIACMGSSAYRTSTYCSPLNGLYYMTLQKIAHSCCAVTVLHIWYTCRQDRLLSENVCYYSYNAAAVLL